MEKEIVDSILETAISCAHAGLGIVLRGLCMGFGFTLGVILAIWAA